MFRFLFSILKIFVFCKLFKWLFNIFFNNRGEGSSKTNTGITSGKRIPKRIRIGEKWYNVNEGWAGTLNLSEWMSPPKFTAREPYAHTNDLYFVYDTSGVKVGEFDIFNQSYSGAVNNIEM